jgi:hypothetical protein
MVLPPCRSELDSNAKRLMPDTIVMNDGRFLHGLIVKNDAGKVTLQQRNGEVDIPKNDIRRIEDQTDSGIYFADIVDPGKLPPWRMIVQDLRSDDSIRSFRQIPATTIDNGYLKNIPYLSFKINERIEMNVYGDSEHPVCLEFGIYERGEKITRFKKMIRAYLAGILASREEVAALYCLDEKGGKSRVGKFIFQVTPPDAPDAYGGWWISIYDPKGLDKTRLSDAEYAKVTLSFREVNRSNGLLRSDRSKSLDRFLENSGMNWNSMIPDLRGFYRNSMGQLELLTPSFMKKSKPAPVQ